jgi:hypothetical protein
MVLAELQPRWRGNEIGSVSGVGTGPSFKAKERSADSSCLFLGSAHAVLAIDHRWFGK